MLFDLIADLFVYVGLPACLIYGVKETIDHWKGQPAHPTKETKSKSKAEAEVNMKKISLDSTGLYDIYVRMRATLVLLSAIVVAGCSEHRVDTFPEWCEQITGEDLREKHGPPWAVVFSVSYDGEAIRDDYAKFLNELHIEKVNNRAPKMAWREGANLHLINLSSLLVIESEKVIDEWRKGIELAKEYKHEDKADMCLYDTLASMFDTLNIHSLSPDNPGVVRADDITVIDTDRGKRLGERRL
tara:strand:- start:203 stop:931 length:729 start_codon:yes stop_codon:yes gene_type:complete